MTWAYRQAGVDLPHSSREQARMGSPMSRAQLQPGDLVAQERLCP
jgi:cell wall-associated NlpC family hydrolase